MMFLRTALVLFVFGTFAAAQQPHEDETLAETPPVVTHHQMTVNGKPLKYTATAGRFVLKPENGPAEAAIFFTAYTLDGEETRTRPLTFAFNGGPVRQRHGCIWALWGQRRSSWKKMAEFRRRLT